MDTTSSSCLFTASHDVQKGLIHVHTKVFWGFFVYLLWIFLAFSFLYSSKFKKQITYLGGILFTTSLNLSAAHFSEFLTMQQMAC